MTLETKIGLFVAMGMVILIGILISDHLAVVQDQEQPEFSDPLMKKEFVNEADRDVAMELLEPLRTPKLVSDPAKLQAERDAKAVKPDTLTVDVPAAMAHRPVDREGRPVLEPDRVYEQSDDSPFVHVPDQSLSNEEVNSLSASTFSPSTTRSTTVEVRSGPTYHTVRKGDSLASLARQYLGRTALWGKIYQANRKQIRDPDRLRVGMRLRIPDITTVKPDQMTQTMNPNRVREYRVLKGDTLMDIAQKTMGSVGYWKKLHAANQDRVPNPDRLRVGTVLRIPQN